jgi:glycosyltransferase involved in cell wall biosynthesis
VKIALPILGFGRAGGYRVISKLATSWTQLGHDVEILVNHSSDQPYFPTEAKIRWLDDWGQEVPSSAFANLQKRRGFRQVFHRLCSLWLGLSRYARNADIILANHSLTAWPVMGAPSGARKFYYVQAYEPEYYARTDCGRKPLLQFVSWLTYFFPLRRIVNSPIYFNFRNLKARVFVPPGIDLDVFHPKRHSNSGILSPIRIGCVGRKEPDKGTRYVLEAFRILRSVGVASELQVAYGNMAGDQAGIEGVHVSIPSNDDELAAFYRSVDVLVAPGLVQHGAPHYPVMEALACGTPVITTGYLPANSDNAWIVPVRDSQAISDAIVDAKRNSALRLRRIQNGLRDIAQYSWQSVALRFLDEFAASVAGRDHEASPKMESGLM